MNLERQSVTEKKAKNGEKNSNRRILVIDDDAIICEIAESILADSGWEVAHAYSSSEALESLATNSWPVVLSDVHLPGDSGEMLLTIRLRNPQCQVVMMTGDPTIASMRRAMQAGAYDYLLKPVHQEELLRVTQKALDKFELLSERDRLERENTRYRTQLEELLDRKTAQLRDAELRYRTLFDHAVDPIFLVDPLSATISELNGAACRMLGRKSFDLQGTSIRDYVGRQLDLHLDLEGDDYRVWRISDFLIRDCDQEERKAFATINRIRLGSDTVLQIVARNVNDQSELAQRANLMELELMSEQRLANIGLLASGVAHNINSPLMGIYGLAQVIKMKHPDIEDIDGVIAQVERINGIVRNLMWKSRQDQELAKQDIDLNVLLQEELRFLEADMDFKHNVDKVFDYAHDLPPIWGRYSDFSQSLMNIIRNALDAMHDLERKQLCVSTYMKDDTIVITIKDSGSGIAVEHLPQVFDSFFTTKPPVGKSNNGGPTGTGLGLSTVQKLLSPYNCSFDLQSTIGQGTSFTLCVPISHNQPTEAELSELQG